MFKKCISRVMMVLMIVVLLGTSVLAASTPKYVFYFIGDGMGASQRQAAEFYLKYKTGDESAKLLMNKFPIAGMNTTYSADTLVTDSAAAGTALATGHKTNNHMIAQLPDGTNPKTIMEAAAEKGMATGVAVTSRLTHATPATFIAHVKSRYMTDEKANQYLSSNVDYFAGGGYRYFLPQDGLMYKGQKLKSKRENSSNLIDGFKNKGYNVFLSDKDTTSFRNFNPRGEERVFASFTYSHMPYELDRDPEKYPSLAEMTQKGIEVLSEYKDGFFLMIEGARIDHACHANDPGGTIHDVLAFDEAIKKAYNFYLKHQNETLIVVAADHETGGFGLGFGQNYFLKMDKIEAEQVTTADVLQGKYDGERTAFFRYIAENYGLNDLTAAERNKIEAAMDLVDGDQEGEVNRYGGYDPVAITVTHILSKRANMMWTTYAHSGASVPLSAIGIGADKLGGFKDNTEVGRTMFDILNVNSNFAQTGSNRVVLSN